MGQRPPLADLVTAMQHSHSGPAPSPVADDQQWLTARPALRRELRMSMRKQNRRLVAVIEDPVRGRFFQVGNNEYHFISQLNGMTTIADAIRQVSQRRGIEGFDETMAREICNWLAQMNLLSSGGRGTSDRLAQAAHGKRAQQLMGWLNPVSFRVELLNPDKWLGRLTPRLGWMFSWPVAIVWSLLGLVSAALIHENYRQFCDSAVGILSPDRWLWLLVIWVLLKIVHETAHGVACKRFGGAVPRAGLLFLLLAPLAFVDVTSSWRMASRWRRMIVAAAGMYIELLVAFIAVLVWATTPDGWTRDLAYNVVVMAGISTILFNANPLIRFDGYYLFSDAVGIVNLYGKGQAWLGDRMRHFIFGFPRDPHVCPPGERRIVALYGICSFVWRILLSASLLLAASTLLGGAGLVLAAMGSFFWVVMPVVQSLRRVRLHAARHSVRPLRLAVVTTATTLLLLASFLWIEAPATTSVPAIVQFRDERVLRAAADGFVSQVAVRDGQSVVAGQLLVQLNNPDLQQELVALQRARDASRVQIRIHRQRREIALQQSEQARLESLERQIQEKQVQLGHMEIRAPVDSVVFARGIENLEGSFVRQGDIILRCAHPDHKQVLVSIDQQQVQSVRSRIREPVRLVFSGCPVMATRLRTIDPRATDIPPDLSLTAVAGGPLRVRSGGQANEQDEENHNYRLLAPRFSGHCDLPPGTARTLAVGQRGTALVYGRTISLGGYVVSGCQQWIRKKLHAANPDGI